MRAQRHVKDGRQELADEREQKRRDYPVVSQHKSLKGLSPAMAAGLSETLWSMTDLAEMVDAAAQKPGKRGPYQKQMVA